MATLLLILTVTAAAANAEPLRITLYDKTQTPAGVMGSAVEGLRRILRSAGIQADIVTGDPSATEATVVDYNPPPDAGCRNVHEMALDIVSAPRGLRPGVLGLALPKSTTGLQARVFADHVAEAATRETREYASVLAHAIAHETGHVLLRADAHEKHGLMASIWTKDEYARMTATRNLLFTSEQSRRMRATLNGGVCSHTEARTSPTLRSFQVHGLPE
jgi:hypothetical protein